MHAFKGLCTMANPISSAFSRLPGSYRAAIIIALAVVAYFAIGTLLSQDEPVNTDIVEDRPPFRVLTQTVDRVNRPLTVDFIGRTEAGATVSVRAETQGRVVATPVADGATVEEGTLLCELDADSRPAQLAEARAAALKADADYDAAVRLYDEGFSSEAALKSALAQRDAARARLSQASQEAAKVRVTAPFDGRVVSIDVEPGDVLTPGSVCASFADLDRIVVVGGVPAREAALLSEGDLATISVQGLNPIPGRVLVVSDVADPRTRAFRVEITADEQRQGLRDGLQARAVIVAGNADAARIPRGALVYSDDGQLGVRVIEEMQGETSGTVGFVSVTMVAEDADGVFVAGLPEQARVIVRGQDYVSAGTVVEVATETGEEAS